MGTGTQLTSNEHLLQELEAISAVGIALASGRTDAEVLEVAGRTLPSFVDSMRVSSASVRPLESAMPTALIASSSWRR